MLAQFVPGHTPNSVRIALIQFSNKFINDVGSKWSTIWTFCCQVLATIICVCVFPNQVHPSCVLTPPTFYAIHLFRTRFQNTYTIWKITQYHLWHSCRKQNTRLKTGNALNWNIKDQRTKAQGNTHPREPFSVRVNGVRHTYGTMKHFKNTRKHTHQQWMNK